MRIGIIIGRIGDVDGVALETEKWIQVLRKLGHEIYILAGRFKENIVGEDNETVYRPLSFFSPECEWEQKRAFFFPPDDPDQLLYHLEKTSNRIAMAIFKWILENKIEGILAQNACALPCHLSMGMGIRKVVETTSIPIVTHDHDFAWERGDRYKTPFKEIEEIVDSTFPLQIPHARHAVINTHAKDTLMQRFGIAATVVPNVMDFDQPFGTRSKYNKDLLTDIGLTNDDIPLFQITRIVQRKGIETAIELVSRLDDKNVKLVVTGSAHDDERKGYYKDLIEHIAQKGLEDRVLFAYHRILSHRDIGPAGKKIYSLEDAYAHAVACTYFSTYEGFGNAFVEAALARKPIFVNNYKPVFWPDIGSKGFQVVMIEDGNLSDQAVTEIDKVIHDKVLRREITEHNYALGKQHFSFDVLTAKLEKLFDF